MKFKTIRCGSGLGDAIYLQSVARYFVKQGQHIKVASDWLDVFKYLDVEVTPFTRNHIDIVAHYSPRRAYQDTTQFKDCLLQAGITDNAEFKLDWQVTDSYFIDSLKSYGKPILLIQMARSPMNRKDLFGHEVLPNCNVIQDIINQVKDQYTTVLIGSGKSLFEFKNIDIDLTNKTTVSQLLDVGFSCDAMIGYCSFMIPMAESFDKKCLMVWSSKGLKSNDQIIRSITPKKIIHKQSTQYVIDNNDKQTITDKVNEFLL